jgi:hypothetical protein
MASVDLEMLRAHNPVPDPDAEVDPVARVAALERALGTDASPAPAPASAPARPTRRRPAWWPLVAIIAPLVLAAAALAASGLLSGTPYDPPWAHQKPQVDLGVPVAGGAHLLSLRVPDPAGGPPWGLRVVRTTRGYECVELGRVVGGQLAVLGQDGWFGDDHRFHPVPPSVYDSEACGIVGSAGYALAGSWDTTFASGISVVGGCQYPAPKWALAPKLPVCPARDLRFVAYGVVGPGARAIEYTDGGRRETLRTAGREGAYLVVQRESRVLGVNGSSGGGPGLAGGGGPGSFPGAIAVDYRDGHRCPSADPGPDTCVLKAFTTAGAHIHVKLVPMRLSLYRGRPQVPGTYDAIVRFRAPVAVSSGVLDYNFSATNPGIKVSDRFSLDRDVRRGQEVRWSVNIPACTRQARLAIYLDRATATTIPGRDGAAGVAIATVATLRVHLPAARRVPWC